MEDKEKTGVNEKAQGLYEWWNEKATIVKGYSTTTILSKIAFHLTGILFLIIFSPILVVIFIMVDLDLLSKIQLSESQNLKAMGQKSLDSNDLLSLTEIIIMGFFAFALIVLIFYKVFLS